MACHLQPCTKLKLLEYIWSTSIFHFIPKVRQLDFVKATTTRRIFDVVRSNPPFFPSTHAHTNYSINTVLKAHRVRLSVLSSCSSVTRSSTVDSVILIQGQDDSEKARIFFPEVFFNSHVSGLVINLWWVPQNQQDS